MAYRHEGDEILVNTTTESAQIAPVTARLASGGYVVLWLGLFGDDRGQIFDSDGSKVGDEFAATAHSVAGLADGGFVSVSGDGHDVFVQLFDSGGEPTGPAFIANSAADNQQASSVAVLASGDFVVTWHDVSLAASGRIDVVAQRFSADGTKVGAEFIVSSPTSGFHQDSEVTALAGGGFAITWESDGQIKARVYDETGSPTGGEFAVSADTQFMGEPQIAALASGGFVVVWTKNTSMTGPNMFEGIYARIFDSSGAAVGGERLIAAEGPATFLSLDLAALDTGGFVVTWASASGDGDGTAIRAQVLDGLGNAAGGQLIVNTTATDDQYAPTVAALPAGDFVISWTDNSQTGGDTSEAAIRSQVFTMAGAIKGTAGDDYLQGTAQGDEMFGLAGDDELSGRSGEDRLDGGAGDDDLSGGNGHDRLDGGEGDDVVRGNGGDDILVVSGPGDDRARGGSGHDTLIVDYSDSTDQVEITDCLSWNEEMGGLDGAYGDGSGSNIRFTSIEHFVITGGSAADEIETGRGNDRIFGGGGDDILDGGTGSDRMAGGAGNDTYYVDHANDRALEVRGEGIDLVKSSVSFTLGDHLEHLTLTGNATIGGGNALANRITGEGAANVLKGRAGNDALDGGGGGDKLFGGTGNDTLKGGSGADGFYFNTALNKSNNVDKILDFVRADDTIFLDRDVFTGIAANGTLGAAAFRLGTTAADASDRILYDQATGRIFYDADGAGGAAAVLFAQVAAGTTLTHADFSAYI